MPWIALDKCANAVLLLHGTPRSSVQDIVRQGAPQGQECICADRWFARNGPDPGFREVPSDELRLCMEVLTRDGHQCRVIEEA